MVILVGWFDWRPIHANFAAFGVAFLVSFFGHYRWTFADQRAAGTQFTTQHGQALSNCPA